MHVLPQLRRLEATFPEELVVIGVHAGKYPNERRVPQLEHACRRLAINHPVLNDRKFRTWRSYGIPGWPTLVLLDPHGRVLMSRPGETTAEQWTPLLHELITRYDAAGALDRRPLPLAHRPAPALPAGLAYPEKVLADAQTLFVADTARHRVLVAVLGDRSAQVKMIIGNGAVGQADGSADQARFNQPRGMALHGRTLFVADTGNHLIRAVDLQTWKVTTVAGTGERGQLPFARGRGRDVALASPWDVAMHGSQLVIAMAGSHQLWSYDPGTEQLAPLAGSAHEALEDGSAAEALLAQPCGITSDGQALFFVDSESQAIRRLQHGQVSTLVGTGLFDLGDKDGIGDDALLQHPQAIAHHNGRLYVADTYNHKIKIVDPATRACRTWLGERRIPGHVDGAGSKAAFFEPGGLSLAEGSLYIADTNNHAIRAADLHSGDVWTVDFHGL